MKIQERKIRRVGNSMVVTLSKEFLESINVSESDIVYIDEEKLKEAFTKKEEKSADQLQLEMMIAKSFQKHNELYKELVDK
ncbi:addiction module antitoxin [Enterococcus raffinosus]|uniref:Addiction module antitoxin n=1 Tax=Enterococcus raffinosus TaxID=71452 RepID=A0AAW8STE2_9ENTE|nr:addiction module antitoxin [Enterococcus raffinosus]MBS6430380.1 addiction module antitoxin [Enterococcus raffinosus]MDK7989115.1 addiction module antitoxin [Enterococcus raffinosus]MDT2536771.1 addiction module antitoxin [Enterococcus raffinosus]MDT2570558.1 addiction module antitoxin [Enterococcus raffinosus]QXJ60784.1 addiction module antitoxin [Enterococcus raffinosus]